MPSRRGPLIPNFRSQLKDKSVYIVGSEVAGNELRDALRGAGVKDMMFPAAISVRGDLDDYHTDIIGGEIKTDKPDIIVFFRPGLQIGNAGVRSDQPVIRLADFVRNELKRDPLMVVIEPASIEKSHQAELESHGIKYISSAASYDYYILPSLIAELLVKKDKSAAGGRGGP